MLLRLLTFQKTSEAGTNTRRTTERKRLHALRGNAGQVIQDTRMKDKRYIKNTVQNTVWVDAPQEENGNVNQQLGKEIGINSWKPRECSS